jgi:hypothetical protein
MKNKILIDEELGCAKIVIESKKYGYFEVLIDIEDIELMSGYTWYVMKSYNHKYRDTFYVQTNWKLNDGRCRTLLLHRLIRLQDDILNPLHIDHINCNPLDNRRANLRLVTRQENLMNMTRVKGYCWHKAKRKWQARLMVDGKPIHLGYFDSEQTARAAYLEAKAIHHQIPVRS